MLRGNLSTHSDPSPTHATSSKCLGANHSTNLRACSPGLGRRPEGKLDRSLSVSPRARDTRFTPFKPFDQCGTFAVFHNVYCLDNSKNSRKRGWLWPTIPHYGIYIFRFFSVFYEDRIFNWKAKNSPYSIDSDLEAVCPGAIECLG